MYFIYQALLRQIARHEMPKILCAGNDADLLWSRCAVLNHAGYDSKIATIPEVEQTLKTERFDLLIFSNRLSDSEKCRVLSAARATKTLTLNGLTLPQQLIKAVRGLCPADPVLQHH